MTPTDRQIEFTIRHEGRVLDKKTGLHIPYRDKSGNWTIGIGHLLPDGPVAPWTEDRAQHELRIDLATAGEHALLLCPFLDKSPGPFEAFTDLVFNVGYGKVKAQGHETIQAFNYKQWAKAAEHFKRWDKTTNLKTGKLEEDAGLKRRREEAAEWITE